jgi:hypothetical protein
MHVAPRDAAIDDLDRRGVRPSNTRYQLRVTPVTDMRENDGVCPVSATYFIGALQELPHGLLPVNAREP